MSILPSGVGNPCGSRADYLEKASAVFRAAGAPSAPATLGTDVVDSAQATVSADPDALPAPARRAFPA
ncbi:hypothetical protein ACE14D_22810, partial [Streptomyces sp. Act-28]